MGASNLQIVFRVMLVEARTSLISGATIVTGTILGYSAMAGTVGGGGLGDIASPLRIQPLADGHHAGDSYPSGSTGTDFPDNWYVHRQQAG